MSQRLLRPNQPQAHLSPGKSEASVSSSSDPQCTAPADASSLATGRAGGGIRVSSERALTIDEFSRRYGPSRAMTYRLLKEQKLRGKKSGRSTLITVDAAECWLASLPDYEPNL